MSLELIKNILETCEDLNPKISIDKVNKDSLLSTDLGFDSLALMSLVYELQEKHPDIDEAKALEWKTINDCLKAIS
jgi:acyl carrier protein